MAQARWRIEEDHQLARQVADLDSGQVIRWRSWHRQSTICLLAYIYLAVTAATCQPTGTGEQSATEAAACGAILELIRAFQGS